MLACMPTETRTRRRAATRIPASVVAPSAEAAPHNRPVTQAGLVPLSTRIPPDVKKQIKIAAVEHEVTEQDVVTEALREWLARR
jgi:hypothetical protein